MNTRRVSRDGTALLRRLREPAPPRPEQCGLCGHDLPAGHRHLVDVEERALACTCTACGLLFRQPGAAGGRYRAVPDRYLSDPDGELDEQAWSVLGVPVGTVFLFRNAVLDRLLAFYPGPAGATESELDQEAWERALGASRLAAALEPDVEALLLRRAEGRVESFLVPIDVCYELVGRLRRCWHGFDGGAEARAELDAYFGQLAVRARPLRAEVTA
ncbi:MULTISPECIES: DUF5947 family protein [Kitasatospora]|uniref:DUF5947 family protein n=1 Tax=Kitasatospora cathayae TaxID=3004092 RepID=A0ABY7PX88_9ACTN|nr:DUF5947 family protein [Kitasatospora sp. HUAS 3-15]WBP85006.1 DUF5947 family protein [Kitasatospora sp. HUAS 3-15]